MIQTYNNLLDKDRNFDCITVNTVEELMAVIAKYSSKNEYIFRGANEAKFMMYTSAQRLLTAQNQASFNLEVNKRIEKVWNSIEIMEYFNQNNIPVNDILILGLLQHFRSPSTLLDFTHDINTALFFATDGINLPSKETKVFEIDNYFSVYIINRLIPDFCSLQDVMISGALSANRMVENSHIPLHLIQAEQVLKEFKELTYSQFQTIKRILILGEQGKVDVEIPVLNFKCSYNITNPNINSQSGLFILNTTYNEPLETIIRKELSCYPPLIECVNIHKSLYKTVENEILRPNGICRDTIYPKTIDTTSLKQWLDDLNL